MTAAQVSVIVPTRNRSRLLATTLRGVVCQRNVALEVIVVDEASTDDTGAVVAAVGDRRIRVVHHDVARGVSAARNRGAAEACGEWVAFLDDDDLWAPDKLASQLDAARATGRDWVYTGSVIITLDGRLVHGHPPLPPDELMAAILHRNAIPGGGSNVIVRRSALQRAGPFDTRFRNTEDWEMWIRLAKQGPPAWVCRPLMAYRVHPSNASLDIAEIMRGARLIEQLHSTRLDWGRIHRWLAESSLRSGRRDEALGQFCRAFFRGQAAGVVSDLTTIVRRRLTFSPTHYRRPEFSGPDGAWLADAAAWLRGLEGGVDGAAPR
jgi:glycosyltransferase involved in cell wall biosynthesis